MAAHHVEMEMLHLQCGIQDQLCSAYGGINYIEMRQFPWATVSQIQVPNSIWWELERRLVLIFLGRSHDSSDLHKKVIRELENEGPDSPRLEALRGTAGLSRDAVYEGDFPALGQAMIVNTEAQSQLASRPGECRCAESDRDRPSAWCDRLEGERCRWSGRICDDPGR